jgi:hypothetical protein
MATGLTSFATTFALGDVKPVVYTGITSSTGSTVVSGTYTILARGTPDSTVGTGELNVSGSAVNTGLHTWSTLGVFVVRISLTFSDGIVDNTISSVVSVVALQL